jgi:CRISPR-associated protein Cas1
MFDSMSKDKRHKEKPTNDFSVLNSTEKTTDAPLINVMALHALMYCERLYYLEEVEKIRRANKNVYAGRRLHQKIDKGADIYSLELGSEKLGIRGKVDFIRKKSGKLVVYEYKKGRSKDGINPWPSDRLQTIAYSLLLEDQIGEAVAEARIRYESDKKTIKVPIISKDAGRELKLAVEKAIKLRNTLTRPSITVSEGQCRSCSLSPVCLPEEERFASYAKPNPERLYPPDDDRKVIHIIEQGVSIRKKAEQLIVYYPDKEPYALPGKEISSLVLHGNAQITTQAIHFCAANDIGIHWLSYGGYYVGALLPSAGAVQRKNRQYRAFQDHVLKANLVWRLGKAKVENQLKYALRATRSKDTIKRSSELDEKLSKIKTVTKDLNQMDYKLDRVAEDVEGSGLTKDNQDKLESLVETIRGYEGIAGRYYFSLLPYILNIGRNDFLYFDGRNRRPPKDPFNALLSFGYSLLYKDCVSALIAVGLDPAFGFYHRPRSSAYPLALDLMDLFRVLLWDVPFIGSVNRKQWSQDDFSITKPKVWLNDSGRRKAIKIYESRKQQRWKHPVLNYSLSYARTLELEAKLLEKEWTGAPGLFAKLRLR